LHIIEEIVEHAAPSLKGKVSAAAEDRRVPPTLVMCAPEHFAVTYKINPWMAPGSWSQDHAGHHNRATRGWAALRLAYEDHGAKVLLLPGRAGLPDMVFTANASLVHNHRVLLPRFRFAERQGEEAHLRDYFAGLQASGEIDNVIETPRGSFFEGAGDALWDSARGMFWLGFGYRSDKTMKEIVEQALEKPVVALELVDPRYYHLDTCLCPLSGGEILYYPPAFTEEGRGLITALAGPANLIAASDEDASLFAVNCFELAGKHVFMGRCSAALDAALSARDYSLHHFPLEPFILSGGSARCLTLRLR
jgi:N-dimethylarginine dimethylaminohydrolase